MASIGSISVSVTASVDNFLKNIDLSIAKIGQMASTAAKMGAAMAGATVAGLVALTEHQMEAIVATEKLSEKLGISTEDLVAYQHAADLVGISSETLSRGLGKFVRSIPEGSDVARSFEKVAADITAIKDPAERARAAVEIFGKSGIQLIPLLTSNLAEAKDEAMKFGEAFSRVDAVKVEQAHQAMTKVWQVLKGVGTELAIYVSPYIVGAANNLIRWGTEGELAGGKIVRVLDYVIRNIGTAADYMEYIVAGWRAVQAGISYAIQLQIDYVKWIVKAANAATFGKLDFISDAEKDLTNLSAGFKAAGDDFTKQMKDAYKAASEGAHSKEWTSAFDTWVADSQKAAEKVAKEIDDATKPGKAISGLKEVEKFLDHSKPKKEKDVGGFREISASLLSITGLSMLAKKMEVHDPQLKETNKLLRQIASETADQGEATYSL